jgi:hypothetical protein
MTIQIADNSGNSFQQITNSIHVSTLNQKTNIVFSGRNIHSSDIEFNIYVNGSLISVNNITRQPMTGTFPLGYMYVGIDNNNFGMYGKVYNFGIFDKALTQNEALELYQSTRY